MYEHIRSKSKSAGPETDIQYDFGELQMVMEEINSIAREATENPQLSAATLSFPTPPLAFDSYHSFTDGLEEDLEKIKHLICGESLERTIIPITGMGGIGKTTLARKVYEDQLVMAMFPVRAWVTVSPDHEPEKVFADLLYSLRNVAEDDVLESSGWDEDKIHKLLRGRKYLIVVDDIWSEKAWDDIRKVFPDKRNGSRIVMTTRITGVASNISHGEPPHEMKFMKPDQSWSLLQRKVFRYRECPSELKKMGKDIATSCRGLPLAVVVVARILSSISHTPSSWKEVAENVRSLVQNDEQFDNVMSLSYTNLPLYLRPCFLYMGSFPKDCDIRVSKLIKLWVAEGFVEDEEKAERYLSNLMARSLAFISTMKSNGKVKSCNVHDMVGDLCKRKALHENYERRMSNAHPDLRWLAKAYGSTIRSVISFQPCEGSFDRLRKFKLLRLLDVVDTNAYSLPAAVFDLFHLRYLAFSCPMEIPTAISKLQNLRSLIIRPSKRLRQYSTDEVDLPLEIWMLPLLTHLVSFFSILPNPEGAVSALENLLTLSVVKKLICTEEMMKLIPNLKKLGITYFGNMYQEDYQLHNLVLLHHLEKLTLVLRKGPLVGVEVKPAFPKTLRKLTLSGWRFSWDVMNIVGSLPNDKTWYRHSKKNRERFRGCEIVLYWLSLLGITRTLL